MAVNFNVVTSGSFPFLCRLHAQDTGRQARRNPRRGNEIGPIQILYSSFCFVFYSIIGVGGGAGACCSGSVTTVFLPEPDTFNRLRLLPPPR